MSFRDRLELAGVIAVAGSGLVYGSLRYGVLSQCYDRFDFESHLAVPESAASGALISGIIIFFMSFLVFLSQSNTPEIQSSINDNSWVKKYSKLTVSLSFGWIILLVFYVMANDYNVCTTWQFRKFLAYLLLIPSLLGLSILTKIWLERND